MYSHKAQSCIFAANSEWRVKQTLKKKEIKHYKGPNMLTNRPIHIHTFKKIVTKVLEIFKVYF